MKSIYIRYGNLQTSNFFKNFVFTTPLLFAKSFVLIDHMTKLVDDRNVHYYTDSFPHTGRSPLEKKKFFFGGLNHFQKQ